MLKKIKGLKDYFIYGSAQVVNLVPPLLVMPKIIAVSGADNWGRVGVLIAVYTILGIFIDFGSLLIGVKELSVNKNDNAKITRQLNETYTFRIIIFLFIAALLLAGIIIAKADYKLYLLGSTLLISQVFNPIWIYQSFEKFKIINKIIFVSKVLYVALVYLFITEKEDYVYTVFFLGIANLVIYSYYFRVLHKEFGLSLFSVPKGILIDNFRREFPIVLSNFSIAIYTNGPIILVNHLAGEYLAGIYKVGDTLLSILRSYLAVFFNVSFPKFCNFYSESKTKGYNFLKKINCLNIMLIILGTIVAHIVIIFFLDFIKLDAGIHRDILFCLKFLWLGLIIALNIPFYQLLIFNNHQKIISKISVAGAVLMLCCCYLFTSLYGLQGTITALYIVEVFITVAMITAYFTKLYKTK